MRQQLTRDLKEIIQGYLISFVILAKAKSFIILLEMVLNKEKLFNLDQKG